MKLNKLALTVLLMLVLSATFVVLSPKLALANDAEKQKAETLIQILENNNQTVLAEFSNLETQNITVPPTAETKYNQALAHTTEAINKLNEDNFSGASSEAVEAMQLFKEALALLQNVSQTEPSETQVAAENITRLKAAINQGFIYVERLENMSTAANAVGYNTTVLDIKIAEAKTHLVAASDDIDDQNYDDAFEEARTAKALIAELRDSLNALTQAVKVANIERYLQEAEDRVADTKASILNSTDLTTNVRAEAIAALNNSESALADARESLDNSNTDEAVTDLKEAKDWEDVASVVVNSTSTVATNDSLTPTATQP